MARQRYIGQLQMWPGVDFLGMRDRTLNPVAYPAWAQSVPFLLKAHFGRVHVEIGWQWWRLGFRSFVCLTPDAGRSVKMGIR
jgi:hypothetical protein